MLFNSLKYAIFLPVVFALYWIIPHKYRCWLLLIASYYFYMSWNIKYVLLIAFITAVAYFAGLGIEKKINGKIVVFISAFLSLSLLFVFKYFGLFFDTANNILSHFAISLHPVTLKLILPVGISFYTFQAIGYVIDVYRKEVPAEHNYILFATFISFFPQLVAGPIERTSNLLPQIRDEKDFDYDKAVYGVKLICVGLYKKIVIADNLAPYVDRIYNNISSYTGFSIVLATLLFTIQIYCDFSGYTDIARGSAKLLGIDLMENFKSPFFSTTIREYWSRWHISLSTWFKDYFYIPLGGNRKGKARHSINLFLTFLVSGLWHGANWTFVLWGSLHGLLRVFENVFKIKEAKKRFSVEWWVRCLVIFIAVSGFFPCFRANSLSDIWYAYSHMLDGVINPASYLHDGFANTTGIEMGTSALITCILVYLLPLTLYDFFSLKTDVLIWIGERKTAVRYLFYAVIVFIILFFHYVGEVSFIYFQF